MPFFPPSWCICSRMALYLDAGALGLEHRLQCGGAEPRGLDLHFTLLALLAPQCQEETENQLVFGIPMVSTSVWGVVIQEFVFITHHFLLYSSFLTSKFSKSHYWCHYRSLYRV